MRVLNKKDSIEIQKNVVLFYVLGAIVIEILTISVSIILASTFSGNFVFSNQPTLIPIPSIEIADNLEFESASTTLYADSLVDEIGITYASLKLNEILQSEGQYIDPNQKYMAYSFYIKNTGAGTITVDYLMRLTEVSYWMEDYVRILIIENDGDYQMYQKADLPDENNNIPQYNQLPPGINFESEFIVFRETILDFGPGEVRSFRVIIWLEEQDPDMNDDQQSGSIETELVFIVREEYPVGSTQSRLLSSENENIWLPLANHCIVQFGIHHEEDEI